MTCFKVDCQIFDELTVSAPNESSRIELYVNSTRLVLTRVELSRVEIIKIINSSRVN
jgi:hypothetical protein